jgi:hypothetical protein
MEPEEKLSLAAFAFSAVALVLGPLGFVPAVMLAHAAVRRAKASGRSCAVARTALWVSYGVAILSVAMFVALIFMRSAPVGAG